MAATRGLRQGGRLIRGFFCFILCSLMPWPELRFPRFKETKLCEQSLSATAVTISRRSASL
jgi:hypothetical protein